MNLTRFFLASVFLLIFAVEAHAKTVINGSSQLSHQEFEALTINGSLTFDNLRIKNKLIVNGSVRGKNLTCAVIKSSGSCDIDELNAERLISSGSFKGKKVSLSDDLEFSGSSKIESGTLNNIKAATSRLVLVDTSVRGNIFFRKGTSSSCSFWEKCLSFFGFESATKSPQILELSGKSIVVGDVTFEGDQGEVHLFDASQIKGNVVNAKIIQK